MIFKENDLGFEYRADHFLVFFGNRNSSLENIKAAYPNLKFHSLWQIHGNDFLKTTFDSEKNRKADAHWTDSRNQALISKSADCIPLLAVNVMQSKVISIHAGWRGVQNRIIPKVFSQIGHDWNIFIGPHILKNSFDIQNDCLEKLEVCTRLNRDLWFFDGKADLYKIVLDQLDEVSIKTNQVKSLLLDTKTDLRFHSFRRDKELSGRQNSFVALL